MIGPRPMMDSNRHRVLLIHAHPAPHRSLVNRRLMAEAEDLDGVTVRHLYEIYPDFLIDVGTEQRLMEQHDIIVLQHPMYWYSAPALVKEWMDLVWEPGWAYGAGGNALTGKGFSQVVSCGGGKAVYCSTGKNRHTVGDFLLPFRQSARLCGMRWIDPFVVYGAGAMRNPGDIESFAPVYRRWLEDLRDQGSATAPPACDCWDEPGTDPTLHG
jgi:glutathione-regulated potassium-efflux system ancillary protein KefG